MSKTKHRFEGDNHEFVCPACSGDGKIITHSPDGGQTEFGETCYRCKGNCEIVDGADFECDCGDCESGYWVLPDASPKNARAEWFADGPGSEWAAVCRALEIAGATGETAYVFASGDKAFSTADKDPARLGCVVI